MLPLQNQEPVLAHPCRHLGCPKTWFWRTSTESGTCHKYGKGFSLQNQGTQSNFFGALLWFSETLKPLQNEEPTVSANYKIVPPKSGTCNCISLQALRLSKNMVLADPPGVLIMEWIFLGEIIHVCITWMHQSPLTALGDGHRLSWV